MERKYSRGYTRTDEYENEQKKSRRSPAAIIIMVLFAVAVIAIIVHTYVKRRTTYTDYEVTATREVSGGAKYIRYAEGYIRYTSDGAEATGDDGGIKWNVSYNMKEPVADVCGDYAAFADRGGRTLCITDGSGANYSISTPDDIVSVSVASQGITAVWTDAGEEDHIYIYNLGGEILIELETRVVKDGFPIAIELSPDGRKFVTSYVRLGDEQESWITFYNFGAVGQNYADKIVGSFSYGNRLVPDIRFMNDDRVCVFYENGCTIYKMPEIPEELKTITFENNLAGISSGNKYICLSERQSSGGTALRLYDSNGNSVSEIITGMDYSGLYVGDEELIVYNNSACIIYRTDGEEKFRTQMKDSIRLMYPTNSEDKYTAICENRIDSIRLVTEKEEADREE